MKGRDTKDWVSIPQSLRKLIHGKILDFGCGTGADVKFLKDNNFDITGYDPHYAPEYPGEKFDTIICNYVLNVLFPEEQSHVLMAVSELLKSTGKAYYAVRRDIKKSGFRKHIKHNRNVYQCNVILPYKSVIKKEHCEVYEYQHINQLKNDKQDDCPFCCPTSVRELVTESATVYAMFDKYPVSKGHTLIIPKRHVSDCFELSNREKTACCLVADRVKMLLDLHFQPVRI